MIMSNYLCIMTFNGGQGVCHFKHSYMSFQINKIYWFSRVHEFFKNGKDYLIDVFCLKLLPFGFFAMLVALALQMNLLSIRVIKFYHAVHRSTCILILFLQQLWTFMHPFSLAHKVRTSRKKVLCLHLLIWQILEHLLIAHL